MVAPPGRQHLAAAARCCLGQSGLASLPEDGVGATAMACAAARLAFAKERAAGTVRTIDGMERGPWAPPRRTILASVCVFYGCLPPNPGEACHHRSAATLGALVSLIQLPVST